MNQTERSRRQPDPATDRVVELTKPLGLILEERSDSHDVFVAGVVRGGNADKTGQIRVGDTITMCSAVFGTDMWSTRGVGLDRFTSCINARSGRGVSLVVESPPDTKALGLLGTIAATLNIPPPPNILQPTQSTQPTHVYEVIHKVKHVAPSTNADRALFEVIRQRRFLIEKREDVAYRKAIGANRDSENPQTVPLKWAHGRGNQVYKAFVKRFEEHVTAEEWAQEAACTVPQLQHDLKLGSLAIRELLMANDKLIHKHVRGLSASPSTPLYEEMFAEAQMGMIRAAEKFNIDNVKKARFSTYATIWMRSLTQRYNRENTLVRVPAAVKYELNKLEQYLVEWDSKIRDSKSVLVPRKKQTNPNQTQLPESKQQPNQPKPGAVSGVEAPPMTKPNQTTTPNMVFEVEQDDKDVLHNFLASKMNTTPERVTQLLEARKTQIMLELDRTLSSSAGEKTTYAHFHAVDLTTKGEGSMNELSHKNALSDAQAYLKSPHSPYSEIEIEVVRRRTMSEAQGLGKCPTYIQIAREMGLRKGYVERTFTCAVRRMQNDAKLTEILMGSTQISEDRLKDLRAKHIQILHGIDATTTTATTTHGAEQNTNPAHAITTDTASSPMWNMALEGEDLIQPTKSKVSKVEVARASDEISQIGISDPPPPRRNNRKRPPTKLTQEPKPIQWTSPFL